MALVELNIYNDDDEIIKTYSTNRIRWGVFCKAVELEDEIKDANAADVIKAISDFMFVVFPSITPDDLAKADYSDLQNVFKMVVNMSGHIAKNG